MHASRCGNTDNVRELLNRNADHGLQSSAGSTGLMVASGNGHTHTVRELLGKNCQCTSEDNCPSRDPQNQAPELPSGGRITWRKGLLDDVPPALRDWDPGVDAFGVAYVGITRHPDGERQQICKKMRATDFGCGKWCVSGDPNIKSFYEFYIPTSGAVVDIGRGWAQRVLDKWGRKGDRAQSDVDAIINKELAGILDQKKALSMEELKLEKTKLMRELETTHPIYRQKRGEIVKVRA